MKEIKFRLLNHDNKIVGYEKWSTGTYNSSEGYYIDSPKYLYSKDGKYWNPDEIIHRYKNQFTGIQDKEGNDIYEADIIKTSRFYKNLLVKWDYDQWALFDHICNELSIDSDHDEVIGNIFESPKLLESEE
jgi:YopX protein